MSLFHGCYALPVCDLPIVGSIHNSSRAIYALLELFLHHFILMLVRNRHDFTAVDIPTMPERRTTPFSLNYNYYSSDTSYWNNQLEYAKCLYNGNGGNAQLRYPIYEGLIYLFTPCSNVLMPALFISLLWRYRELFRTHWSEEVSSGDVDRENRREPSTHAPSSVSLCVWTRH